MEHPPELGELERIFEECVQEIYGEKHQYKMKFFGFDENEKPVVWGTEYDFEKDDPLDQEIKNICFSYQEDKERWEMRDSGIGVIGWSTQETSIFLLPVWWHLFDWKKHGQYIEGWEDDPNLKEGVQGNNHFSTTYCVKAIRVMHRLIDKFPIVS